MPKVRPAPAELKRAPSKADAPPTVGLDGPSGQAFRRDGKPRPKLASNNPSVELVQPELMRRVADEARFEHVAALVLQIVVVAEADKREDARVGTPASGGGEEALRSSPPRRMNPSIGAKAAFDCVRMPAWRKPENRLGCNLLFSQEERYVSICFLRRAVEHEDSPAPP